MSTTAEQVSIVEAERALIGAALHDNQLLSEEVSEEDFYDPRHGALWRLMRSMEAAGEPVEITLVLARLGELAPVRVSGDELFACFSAAPLVPAVAVQQAALVASTGARRRIYRAAQRIAQLAESGISPSDLTAEARAMIDAAHNPPPSAVPFAQLLAETIETFDAPARLVPTPWPALDRLVGGWRPGALYVIGGRPGTGKSLMATQSAVPLADHGHVLVQSIEMSRREVVARILAHRAHVALGRMYGRSAGSAPLSDSDREAIAQAQPDLERSRLHVIDDGHVTAESIRAQARALTRLGPLAGVVVDYLQLISPARGDRRPRHEVIAEVSRALKILARELDCPVIALAQLNRESERSDSPPTLANLRDSGAIEQDADVVMLLHAPDPYGPKIELIVAKNRHGLTGLVALERDGAHAELRPRLW